MPEKTYEVLDATPLQSLADLDEISRNDSFLRDLAERSGGRFFDAASSDLKTIVNDISSELSHTYSLAYSPSNPTQNAGKRKIKVELNNKKANLRYKHVYETKAKK